MEDHEKDKQDKGQHSVSSSTSGEPGSNTLNGAGTGAGDLSGDQDVVGNPENTSAQIYRDKDPEKKK